MDQRKNIDVCLVNMPYYSLTRPNLGLSLIKAILSKAGIQTRVLYENLAFVENIGLERYQFCAFDTQRILFGDWTFAQAAFPGSVDADRDDRYLEKTLVYKQAYLERFNTGIHTKSYLQEIRTLAHEYINDLAKKIVSLKPKILGSSSFFAQHTASLAILRKVKQLDPSIVTLMGGISCESLIGQTTHNCFPWVDYLVSGECDDIITDLVKKILKQGTAIPADELWPGVFGPVHRGVANINPARLVAKDMDSIPMPLHDDYFTALDRSPIKKSISPALPFETSRGCWWGFKQLCTFCGYNREALLFREKSPARAINEINELEKTYGISRFFSTDSILSLDYYKTVFPVLAKDSSKREIYVEVKSNISREKMKQLKKGGVTWIQPGMESLLTDTLGIMNKGVKAYQNIQFLKWARELGLRVTWNFLWGFPEETDEMYSPLKSLIPQIEHLPPPSQLSRIQIRRYNYYFENAQKLNLNLSPIPIYSYIYDLEDADLTGMSYCFNPHTLKDSFDHPEFDEFKGRPNIQAADILLEQWRASFWSEHTPVLSMNDTGEYIEIKDTRECAVNSSCRLSGLHRLVYLLAETAPREEETQQLLNERFNTAHDKQEIDSVIKELCDKKLLLKLDKRLISLAVQGDLPPIPSLKEYPGGSIITHPAGFSELLVEKIKN